MLVVVYDDSLCKTLGIYGYNLVVDITLPVFVHLTNYISFAKMAQNDQVVSLHGLDTPFKFFSQRSGTKIAYKGYCYVKEKTLKNGNTTYKCDYPNCQCSRRITTNIEENVCSFQDHNMHAPDQSLVEVKISQARFKQTAADQPVAPLSALLNAEIAKVPRAVRGDLPSDTAMKRSGQRIRRKDFPPELKCAQDVILMDNWSKVNGESWVIHQNANEANSCIVLATKSNLRHLKQSSVWYGDGTFDVSTRCTQFTVK